MGIGRSGRIVIEVEPNVKRTLYAALARDGSTLKEWFLKSADAYLSATNPSGSSAACLAESISAAKPRSPGARVEKVSLAGRRKK